LAGRSSWCVSGALCCRVKREVMKGLSVVVPAPTDNDLRESASLFHTTSKQRDLVFAPLSTVSVIRPSINSQQHYEKSFGWIFVRFWKSFSLGKETVDYVCFWTSLFALRQQQNKKGRNIEITKHTHTHRHATTHSHPHKRIRGTAHVYYNRVVNNETLYSVQVKKVR